MDFLPLNADTAGNFLLARWVFLRILGIVYLIAFLSMWVQIKGLIGTDGILPAEEYLSSIKQSYNAERFFLVPTVFWINASNAALTGVCALGVLASIALIFGLLPMGSAIVLWILYLSIVSVGQDFLSFQWDILLLEVGFLAIFFSPLGVLPGLGRETALIPIILLCLWFLLFRFMFESGVVKLTSGDRSWLDLTALTYHYFSQPLPHAISWYIHHLPLWFHKLSVLLTYLIELIFPFLIFFGGRPAKMVAAAGITILMIIITLTGNYNFFTLLTVAMVTLIVPDAVWEKILPDRLLSMIGYGAEVASVPQWFSMLSIVVAILVLFIGLHQVLSTVGLRIPLPRPVAGLIDLTRPFALVNPYGLFRVMTKDRPEIIIEGSNDGEHFEPYEFRYKPGDLSKSPRLAEPHNPRLDWQMWFAALSTFNRTPWFQQFTVKLLQGSPDVLALLETNPFPDAPPKYIRAQLFDYGFSDRGSKAWWKRKFLGSYSPVLSLQETGLP